MTDEDKKDAVEAEEKTVEDKPEAEKKPVEEPKSEEKAEEKPAEEPAAQKSEAQEKMKKAAESAAHFAKETGKKAGESMKALWGDPLVCTHHLDGFINWVRESMPSKLYLLLARAFVKLGHVGLVLSAAAGIVFGVVALFRQKDAFFLFSGIVFALFLIVGQYIADKFLRVGDSMVQSSPSKLKSDYFLPSIALICVAFEVAVVVASVFSAINASSAVPLLKGLAIFVMLAAIKVVSVHPTLITVEVEEDSDAAGEALGIAAYAVKVTLRTVPIAFGLLSALGTVLLWGVTLKFIVGKADIGDILEPAEMILRAAALPFAAYLAAVVYRFAEGVFKSILTLGKD